MTQTQRRLSRSQHLHAIFSSDDLEGEECVDCGHQATVVYEDTDGLIHFCDEHDPESSGSDD